MNLASFGPVVNVSFSGGRTSGFMTKMLLEYCKDLGVELVVTFANTGLEHPKTLEFVHNCDVHFGFNTVWLEAEVHHGSRRASSHRVVTYETADRKGRVFEEVIRKYGIPNLIFQPCNREMKLNTMKSYRRSIGVESAPVAIGIRADERRRVAAKAAEMNIIYPLVDLWPTDKQDVLDWWGDQPFDLEIEEFEGNCLGCFKKSYAKHFQQIDKDPSVYEWHRRMEKLYRSVGPQEGDRVFFRGGLTVDQLFALRDTHRSTPRRRSVDIYANGGCTESCEPFLMEEAQ